MVIVLLSGKSFTGKDTLAERLPELKRVSVADTMKRAYMIAHPGVDLFDRAQKEAHRLQLKAFTHQWPLASWLERTPYADGCIVTDVRTRQEIEYIRRKFSSSSTTVVTVRLEVKPEERRFRGWVYQPGYDDSYLETELDDYDAFDYSFYNNSPQNLYFCTRVLRARLAEDAFVTLSPPKKSNLLNSPPPNNINIVNPKVTNDKPPQDNHDNDDDDGFRFTRAPFHEIPFLNLVPLLRDPVLRKRAVQSIASQIRQQQEELRPTHVLGIESGGFPLGAWLAHELDLGFALARKPGKLPPPVVKTSYSMEYRPDNEMEMQSDALFQAPLSRSSYEMMDISNAARVIVVDDVVATGGTLLGAMKLVRSVGAVPVAVAAFASLAGFAPPAFDVPCIVYRANLAAPAAATTN